MRDCAELASLDLPLLLALDWQAASNVSGRLWAFILTPGMLFGRPVLRVPHPSFLRWTKTHLFSDPVKAAIVDELEIPLLSFTDLEVMVR
jgi:hypothetical protein